MPAFLLFLELSQVRKLSIPLNSLIKLVADCIAVCFAGRTEYHGLPAAGYFVTEIQSMMHGFGDSRTPLLESASLIETIVQQQQWAIINQAADVAAMRGAKCIGPEDILFLLRKDRIKTHRLLKYLGTSGLPHHKCECPFLTLQ
jgi:hypothetical protein